METVLITGGSGLIGSSLTALLVDKGYRVIILSRRISDPRSTQGPVSYAKWDIPCRTIDQKAITEADYIIHLAGANVGSRRWTSARKKQILESRTHTANLLFDTLQKNQNKVKAVISASAIGYYDATVNKTFTENDPPGNDFLGSTCQQWEKSILQMEQLGKRVVINRLGIVLSNKGGMVKEFLKPLRFGLAPIIGNGKQLISWIHFNDACRIFLHGLQNNAMQGIYNAVAPYHTSQKEMICTLANALNGKNYIAIPAPAFVLKMVLGEMSIEVLKSCKVSDEKLLQTGFGFNYPTMESATGNLVGKNDSIKG